MRILQPVAPAAGEEVEADVLARGGASLGVVRVEGVEPYVRWPFQPNVRRRIALALRRLATRFDSDEYGITIGPHGRDAVVAALRAEKENPVFSDEMKAIFDPH